MNSEQFRQKVSEANEEYLAAQRRFMELRDELDSMLVSEHAHRIGEMVRNGSGQDCKITRINAYGGTVYARAIYRTKSGEWSKREIQIVLR